MALPAFIETRLPALTGWEYSVESLYDVTVLGRGRGAAESRNLSVEYPRRKIVVRIPGDKVSDIIVVNRWHHALRGRAVGFRVMDPTDFLSFDLNPYDDLGAVDWTNTTPTDQPLIEIDGAPGTYQLYKDYAIQIDATTELQQLLPIFKPVQGEIKVANDSGVEQVSTRWTIDWTRGILTPQGGFVGTPTTWGGRFDLPMRFNSTLPMDVREHQIAEATFELIELPR